MLLVSGLPLLLLLHNGLVMYSRQIEVQEIRQLVNRYPDRRCDREWRSIDLWRIDIGCRDDRCHRVYARGKWRKGAAP